ncbi:MAG: threonylcarbamoyl-AMP synthase [Anaerolineae bacterium]|nr:threonylcarbamoyl-AMP synthase [Anaerolineae bacterium]
MTETISITNPSALQQASEILARGGIIAFPTDTVYGIAADPKNDTALKKIYQVKNRPDEKALPILIGNISHLDLVCNEPMENVQAMKLARAFWPGPITLLFEKSPILSTLVTSLPTVGVRIPDYEPVITLLLQTGPLAVTSANRSGAANSLTAEDVLAQLDGMVDLLVDGGKTPGSKPSTVVDCSRAESFKILREGTITEEMLRACLHG